MTAPEHLTISGPEDILGYIPHSLGYWPSQSLVAMTMQGKRLGATLRVDLPEGGGRRGREAFARTVADYLLADKEADGTLLAFFAAHGFDEPGREGAPPAFRLLLADLECALGLAGMPVRDAWLVGEEYWRNVYCTDSCCPLPGRPVAEIRDSRLNAEMVYLGSSVGAPPGAAPPDGPGAPAADDPVVMAAERDWHQALRGKGTLRAQFEAVLDAWSAALQAVASAPAPTAGVPPAAGSRGAGSRGAPVHAGPVHAGPVHVRAGRLWTGPWMPGHQSPGNWMPGHLLSHWVLGHWVLGRWVRESLPPNRLPVQSQSIRSPPVAMAPLNRNSPDSCALPCASRPGAMRFWSWRQRGAPQPPQVQKPSGSSLLAPERRFPARRCLHRSCPAGPRAGQTAVRRESRRRKRRHRRQRRLRQ